MGRLSYLLIAWLTVAYLSSAFAQSPGDTVGWTQSEYQCLGSTGHRIAVDAAGNVHFTWMGGDAGISDIRYNYVDSGYYMWPQTGTSVSKGCFPQLSIRRDCAVIPFRLLRIGMDTLCCAIDIAPGLGGFQFSYPPDTLMGTRFMWPYVTVDRHNRIHIVATGDGPWPQPFGYTRSVDGGQSWTLFRVVDTVQTISPMITSSPVSDKVAIVYCHPVDDSQLGNDVYYTESLDGLTWDFNFYKINQTCYGFGGDSLFAYDEVDATYDYNDNLIVVWNARYAAGGRESDRVFLYFTNVYWDYNAEIGYFDVPHIDRCRFGEGNLALNKLSLAADSANNVYYITYTRFDTLDCASDSTANGEIFTQYSCNWGVDWSVPQNLTNSHTPGCTGPNCASDLFPSMAECIDNYLHIFYVCRRYPDVIYPDISSPMLYLRVPAGPQGVGESGNLPKDFNLSQNYPNPFNALTTIEYSLKNDAGITLSVYNVTGQKVATLFEGMQEAGEHQIIWDAEDVSSGIYFARFETAGASRNIRMTLLK